MKYLAVVLAILTFPESRAQNLTQTVRGSVVDADAQYPLPGATVLLISDTTSFRGAQTDENGEFRIENVPVGRHQIKISFVGRKDVFMNNVVVTSAKEVVLNVQLESVAIGLEEIAVVASHDGNASHEMALGGSARSFTIEETQRYAGSRGDPARMASNFAGVQGADDSRNDIVIRGNSPQAVLWRLEGINIPNPNHFNIPGTAGGPVCMINNQTLANSDFFTGAFPAEFGNSISGVFDLRLRNGNNEKHEFSGQFGFLGTELFAEGPISKKTKSSYLAAYRYSTLAIFNKLGIDIGTDAVPRYQDFTFKANFRQKNGSSLSFFGLGGRSNIDILISDQKPTDRNIYGENDRDQYFKTGSSVIGASYQYPVNTSTFFSASVAVSGEAVDAYHELVYRDSVSLEVDSLQSVLNYRFGQSKASVALLYSRKLKSRGVMNAGLNADEYFFDFRDSVRNINEADPQYGTWRTRWNSRETGLLVQPFIQWKLHLSENVSIVAGIHSQYFSLSESFAPIEPRLGARWHVSEKASVNLAAGMHSQIQPTYLYFYGVSNDAQGNPLPHNKGMDFSRSIHLVGGYEKFLGEDFRLKTEVYYQHLYQIPVDKKPSSFSVLNTGAGFSRFFPDTLVNEGIGRNYGIEVTLEKFYSNGYLFLVTGSLFESKYQGSDQIWRDTDFNGNYVLNMLATKEWLLNRRNGLSLGGRMTTAGGKRYGDVDIAQSEIDRDVIWVDASRNSRQFAPYFRADLRLNYKINRAKVTHEIAIDLVNVFNTQNILKLTYVPINVDKTDSHIKKEYQLGFLPLFYYRLDF